jgi:hypothetical protein
MNHEIPTSPVQLRDGLCDGKIVDLYSEWAWFIFRLWHWLSWLKKNTFFWALMSFRSERSHRLAVLKLLIHWRAIYVHVVWHTQWIDGTVSKLVCYCCLTDGMSTAAAVIRTCTVLKWYSCGCWNPSILGIINNRLLKNISFRVKCVEIPECLTDSSKCIFRLFVCSLDNV